jgi:hypothetical protein
MACEPKNYYVQFMLGETAGLLCAETVGNAHLEGPHVLSDEQLARLGALGWTAPEPASSEERSEGHSGNHLDCQTASPTRAAGYCRVTGGADTAATPWSEISG